MNQDRAMAILNDLRKNKNSSAEIILLNYFFTLGSRFRPRIGFTFKTSKKKVKTGIPTISPHTPKDAH